MTHLRHAHDVSTNPSRRGLAAVAASLLVAAVSLLMAAGPARAAAIGAYTTRGAWTFASEPNLHPPKLLTDAPTKSGSLAPGDFLVDNFPNLTLTEPASGKADKLVGQGGPLILDTNLQPVWFNPVPTNVVSTDLQQETYQGQPVLLWWQGVVTNTGATKSGEVVVVNKQYRTVATLRAQGPAGCSAATCWVISVHDAVISGNDIWVTVYRNVPNQNLVIYGGSPLGTVYDAGVQEYDLRTGQLLYTWDALNPGAAASVPLSDSEQPAPAATAPVGTAWDAYHINSVQPLAGGEILVALRNTWAVYLIDTATGKIVWTLGGKASSFKSPSNAQFEWEHDARLGSGGELTLFDDNCCSILGAGKFGKPNGPSQGLALRLDTATHTVSRVAAYRHSPADYVAFLGSLQLLPRTNALVGWGSTPYFTEFSASGKELLDAVWPTPDLTYRALYTGNWIGTPYFPPSGAVSTTHGLATVYASWDGATQVTGWRVLAGSNARHLVAVATAAKTGFETAIGLKRSYGVYKVAALGAGHRVLGTSAAFSKKNGSSGLPQSY